MNYELIREELGHIRRTLQIDEYQALDVHQKAEAAMLKCDEEWLQDVHVCPYCFEAYNEITGCCGESSTHLVPMKLAQYNYMCDCDKSIEQALAYTGEIE